MLTKREVIKQLQWLYCNAHSYPLIKDINYPEITDKFVGQISERLNPNNYDAHFEEMYIDSRYSILLDDDSLVFFEYRFDADENLIQHNLAYVPTPFQFSNESDDEQLDSSQYGYLSKYVRIDFDDLGRTEFTHTYVHMHMGLFEHATRFPISHVISPLEFISLIFTHFYGQPISFPVIAELDSRHKSRLSPGEDEHFKLSFGNRIEDSEQ